MKARILLVDDEAILLMSWKLVKPAAEEEIIRTVKSILKSSLKRNR